MAIEALKLQRGTIKAKLTRFKHFLENPTNKDKITEIRERLMKIEQLDKNFETVQEAIEKIYENNNDALENEMVDRNKFEDDYYQLLSLAKEMIQDQRSNVVRSENTTSTRDNLLTYHAEASLIRQLPKISIPKFNGDLSKWIKFRDSFNSLVNNQAGLSKIDKFNYLSDALEDEALRSIESLGISEANYDNAWKKLQSRYEDSNELIEHHTKELCEIPSMSKGSYTHLRRIIDDATNHLAALASLGESTAKCDSLLIYIISKKLDEETKKQWKRRKAATSEKRTFNNFIEVLEAQCKYLKISTENQSTNKKVQEHTGPNKAKRASDRVVSHAMMTKSCSQCNEKHPLYACNKFKALDISARIECVKAADACFNCLRSGHRAGSCTSGPCRKCGRRHNTLLHLEKSAIQGDARVGEANQSTVLTAQTSGTYTHVLLGTAIVEIEDREGNVHECRALLDSGSQVHFITKELCNKLKASKSASATIVSGIQQATIDLKHKTNIKIRSKATGYKATITCLITPKITDNMPNMRINKGDVKIPQGIILADPNFDRSKPVDLLIGAALFWDLLCVGQIKENRSQPYLQKTKLGWIVTGSIEYQREPQSSRFPVTL